MLFFLSIFMQSFASCALCLCMLLCARCRSLFGFTKHFAPNLGHYWVLQSGPAGDTWLALDPPRQSWRDLFHRQEWTLLMDEARHSSSGLRRKTSPLTMEEEGRSAEHAELRLRCTKRETDLDDSRRVRFNYELKDKTYC